MGDKEKRAALARNGQRGRSAAFPPSLPFHPSSWPLASLHSHRLFPRLRLTIVHGSPSSESPRGSPRCARALTWRGPSPLPRISGPSPAAGPGRGIRAPERALACCRLRTRLSRHCPSLRRRRAAFAAGRAVTLTRTLCAIRGGTAGRRRRVGPQRSRAARRGSSGGRARAAPRRGSSPQAAAGRCLGSFRSHRSVRISGIMTKNDIAPQRRGACPIMACR